MSLETVRTVVNLREGVARWRDANKTVAMVPTMGAIHEGHLSLVRQAQDCADRIVASIFVNPLQFGANEDFNTYPRDEAEDAAKLTEAGVHLLYAPGPKEMYPEGFATNVHVSRLSEGLCGQSRPSHFDGVATVVAKLLLQCAPDIAIFGEKDYQQLLVIKRLVRDLDIPIEIAGAPIVREADGLALSSRNAYLSPNERRTAPILYRSLEEAAREIAAGLLCEAALEKASATLKEAGFRIDYLEARDPQTLATLSGPVETARLLVAAFLGKTRLIDNVAVPPPGT